VILFDFLQRAHVSVTNFGRGLVVSFDIDPVLGGAHEAPNPNKFSFVLRSNRINPGPALLISFMVIPPYEVPDSGFFDGDATTF
jgi:hypothetical protein